MVPWEGGAAWRATRAPASCLWPAGLHPPPAGDPTLLSETQASMDAVDLSTLPSQATELADAEPSPAKPGRKRKRSRSHGAPPQSSDSDTPTHCLRTRKIKKVGFLAHERQQSGGAEAEDAHEPAAASPSRVRAVRQPRAKDTQCSGCPASTSRSTPTKSNQGTGKRGRTRRRDQ